MLKQGGNTAESLSTTETVDEPTMEEILASIKQIIADDEAPDDGLTERERYTHPDNPSNNNDFGLRASLDDSSMQAAMEAEMQAEMARGFSAAPEIEAPRRNTFEDQTFERPGDFGAEAAAASAALAKTLEPKAVPEHETLGQRAARLRSELANGTTTRSADERIEKYRARGRMHLEELAAKRAAAAREEVVVEPAPTPQPAPMPDMQATMAQPSAPHINTFAPHVAPTLDPVAAMPSTEELAEKIAAQMMSEKSGEIETLVGEILRPTIRNWLSENLPTIVENMVREEIEAVSRGRKAS